MWCRMFGRVAGTGGGRRLAPCAVLCAGMLAAWLLTAAGPARAEAVEDLVIRARISLENIWNNPQTGPFVKRQMKNARAVIIVPRLLKGGFIIGGEGGSGLMLARGEDDRWSYPAFVTVGSASFGLQFGGEASEVLFLIMTGKGLQAILRDQVKIGGELNGAIGPTGSGFDASITSNLKIDILSYSIAEGAFIGAGIEGTVILPRERFNREYYGKNVTPEAIVLKGEVGNPQADDLRGLLQRLVRE